MKKHAHAIVGALICLPILALAQFPSIPSLKSVPGLGSVPSTGGDASGQNDALVRGCVAANKDVLIANSQMADALGLKDQAAASKATADALTDGATKGNLEDSNKAVSAFTDAAAGNGQGVEARCRREGQVPGRRVATWAGHAEVHRPVRHLHRGPVAQRAVEPVCLDEGRSGVLEEQRHPGSS